MCLIARVERVNNCTRQQSHYTHILVCTRKPTSTRKQTQTQTHTHAHSLSVYSSFSHTCTLFLNDWQSKKLNQKRRTTIRRPTVCLCCSVLRYVGCIVLRCVTVCLRCSLCCSVLQCVCVCVSDTTGLPHQKAQSRSPLDPPPSLIFVISVPRSLTCTCTHTFSLYKCKFIYIYIYVYT